MISMCLDTVGRSEALERSLKDMDELAVEVFELRKQVDMVRHASSPPPIFFLSS